MQESIFVKGARENNLKNIDIEIPRDKLVVVTGLSGSGKSSLAFDTIYAEGQRRYVESLSSYARMFLGQMDKPDVDYIEGLSPAISIDQKTTSKNPRSTVGTVTEIYDYLRLLWARIGIPHCPKCGKEIQQQSIDQIVDRIMALPQGSRIQILAPVVRSRKGEHLKVFEDAKKSGYVRARVDGIIYDLSEEIKLEKNKKHNIEIVVDRLVIKPDISRRITDSAVVDHSGNGAVGQDDLLSLLVDKIGRAKGGCSDGAFHIADLYIISDGELAFKHQKQTGDYILDKALCTKADGKTADSCGDQKVLRRLSQIELIEDHQSCKEINRISCNTAQQRHTGGQTAESFHRFIGLGGNRRLLHNDVPGDPADDMQCNLGKDQNQNRHQQMP